MPSVDVERACALCCCLHLLSFERGEGAPLKSRVGWSVGMGRDGFGSERESDPSSLLGEEGANFKRGYLIGSRRSRGGVSGQSPIWLKLGRLTRGNPKSCQETIFWRFIACRVI